VDTFQERTRLGENAQIMKPRVTPKNRPKKTQKDITIVGKGSITKQEEWYAPY